ncbi:MAG TPA: Do family serine endopeptidase [Gemmatimonadaceae bacterium]|nr:Do family serine endopeptidase [Gemmatimonadaceae bacterium]
MTGLLARARLGVVAVVAFVGGLALAAGFNLTPFSHAQQPGTPSRPPAQAVQPLAATGNAFAAIAEHVTPAVVSIQTQRTTRSSQRGRIMPGIPPEWRPFFNIPEGQQQQPDVMLGTGSGFLVSSDGYILTNNHVVADADKLTVTLTDKREFTAKVVGRDPDTDVAVIKIDGTGFPTLQLGDDTKARIGEWVLAIGNPLGLDFTVTAGIISAKGRTDQLRPLYSSEYAIVDLIQTDAAINPGNSGGPLVNINGEVIGINSAIASNTGYYEGYGFAIPITLAKSVMDDIIKYGRVRRAVMGVSIQPVTAEDAEAAGLKEISGALVGGFPSDHSPARDAGMQAGDVITAVDGHPVDRVATLQRMVRNHQPGETIAVTVMRYGKEMTFHVKLEQAPQEASTVASADQDDSSGSPHEDVSEKLGLSVEPIPAELAQRADLQASQRGLLVQDVDANGPAFGKIQPRRDVILEVRYPGPKAPVHSVSDLEKALDRVKKGGVVSLLVLDAPSKQTRVVTLRVNE